MANANVTALVVKTGDDLVGVVTISDIEMPVMDGIEFYNQTSKLFPNINERFLFVTGDISTDRLVFFKEHNIEFMTHPVSVLEISEKAQTILLN